MHVHTRFLLPAVALAAAACAAPAAAPSWTYTPAGAPAGPVAAVKLVEVYKSPSCSCCHEWEAYLRANGWTVRSIPVDDLAAIKTEHGLPQHTWSCHTAVIDGYVVEGHVPIAAINDLLTRRPAIDGIALPEMPPGSPGMPGQQEAPFDVLAIDDGVVTPFGAY